MVRRVLWVLIALFAAVGAVNAQDAVQIVVFRDEDSLTIYVPGEGQVSLQGLQIQDATGYNHLLQAYVDFQHINFSRIAAPVCLRLVRDDSRTTAPQACATAEQHLQTLTNADVFWHDAFMNQTSIISVIGDATQVICNQDARCDVLFASFPEPPPGMDVEADIENHEVLVLIARFEQMSGNPIEPHREWQFTLNRAIEELGGAVNARVLYVPRYVLDHDEARELSEQYQATLVIWGLARASVLESNYTVTPRWSYVETEPGQTQVVGTIDELRLFVSPGGDTEYILNFVLGQLAYFGEDQIAALPFLESAITMIPDERESEMELGAAYFYSAYIYGQLQSDHETAISYYKRTLEYYPEFASAYNNIGVEYADLDDYPSAIENYDRALQVSPDFVEVYYNRGLAYYDLGDYEVAIENFSHALGLETNDADIYNNRGISYYKSGEFREAIEDFNRALELNPGLAQAYFNRGLSHARLGEHEKAVQDYEQAQRLDPADAETYFSRGLNHLILQEFEDAVENLSWAIELDPIHTDAYGVLGFSYDNLGETEKALKYYHIYLELAGDEAATQVVNRVAELEAMLTLTPAP